MAIMFEVKLRCSPSVPAEADLARCMLINAGVPAGQIVESYQKGSCVVSFYEKSRKRSDYLAKLIRALKLKGIRVSVARIHDRDWTACWKKYFRPFNITPDIRIVPLRMKNARIPPGSKAVYLDTTFAFGSGLHATTRMVAQYLYLRKRGLCDFLDIGTGSGILGLIAYKYGARQIWAIDSDPVAVKTSGNNCRINRCEWKYLKTMKCEDFKPRMQFDFVAANLLTEDLIRLRKKLTDFVAPGGYLAVSGIFHDNYPLFRRGFSQPCLRCVSVAKKNKWCALLFKKT